MRVDVKTGFICNNNCRFCVQADNKLKGNRSLEEIKEDLEKSRERCEGVVLTGGEVTIRDDFFDLVAYAKHLGYKIIQIQTNGRMIASKDFCKKTIEAGATEFSPALHGFSEQQHDYLTRSPGSFRQTVQGIRNLKALGAKVITNTVVVKSNYREIPKIARLLVRLDVDQFQFAFVHAMGKAMDNFESVVPRITLVAPYIHMGLQIGIDAKKTVMAEAMPYCLMKGYEKYVAERFVPETEIRGAKHQNTKDYTSQRRSDGKRKFPQCLTCRYDDVCEGPWREYPERFGDDEFDPIAYEELGKKRIKATVGFSRFLKSLGYSEKDFYFDDFELYAYLNGAKDKGNYKETAIIDVRIKDRLGLLSKDKKSRLFKDPKLNDEYVAYMQMTGYGFDLMKQKRIKQAKFHYDGELLRMDGNILKRMEAKTSMFIATEKKYTTFGLIDQLESMGLPMKPMRKRIAELEKIDSEEIEYRKKNSSDPDEIRGDVVSGKGKVTGVVNNDPLNSQTPGLSILIAIDTSSRTLGRIMRSDAVIVERGGRVSHAAIICRELGIPCIVNAKGAARKFTAGDTVSVDLESGIVTKDE